MRLAGAKRARRAERNRLSYARPRKVQAFVEAPDDAQLFCGRDMERPELVPLGGGTAAVMSLRRPGADGANQDAAGLIPLGPGAAVLAVADGAGGQPGGAAASEAALRELREALAEGLRDGDEPRSAILNAFERANQRLLEGGSGGATTLAVAEIRGEQMRPYHAGDSEILVTGQRGRRKLQIVSHSPVGYAVEAGVLDEREALHHDERHVISNAVGSSDMRIEIGPLLRLAARDTVLLASDGLFDNLHVEEIVGTVRAGPLAARLSALVETCRLRMAEPRRGEPSKPDDLTVIAFRRTLRPRASRLRRG